MNSQFEQDVLNIIGNYYKMNKKIPYLRDLEEDENYGFLIKPLSDKEKEFIKELIIEFFKEAISKTSSKTMKRISLLYKTNPQECLRFRELNETRDSLEKEEFHLIGNLLRVELKNQEAIFQKQENSKFSKFNESTLKHYNDTIKGFFPLYSQIGIKVRKA